MTEIKCETCQGTGRDHLHIWDIGPPIDYFHCETCVGYGTLDEVKSTLKDSLVNYHKSGIRWTEKQTPCALTLKSAYSSLLLDNY